MARRPTILDVARHAGVSKSTVSLVLQKSPQIRPETAEVVRRAIEATGYVYNRAAANLRSSSTGLIGLIINDLRNPFFTEFAASFQTALFARGFATVISDSGEDAGRQDRIVQSMIEHGVAAMVISPAYGDTDTSFARIERAGIPTLQVLRQVFADTGTVPFSSFDYAEGSAQAARHLIQTGSRRIAFVGGLEGRPITAERMRGYVEETARAGMTPLTLFGRPSRLSGAELAGRLLDDHPDVDAAICFNDLTALGMMTEFTRRDIRPGRDFRLVGFDAIEESAQVWPPLSSVACDIGRFATDTAAALLSWLDGGTPPAPVRRQPVDLIVRASSAPRHD
ncbi:LacI family DNA-binding transcriptional regulator (plasmid) [Paracoccus sp. TK19116]|uniref:LacI family DNA-binding transcriptional regulator n=1 Tax=Paracoccus albicereus TaxID=2922394 RepID=A0ABT1MM72_9RHOB|nr:LacI family DNA-binding transcriptional regulator [Paracoccus albicereus]MCQ0969385.1 LacI family DNA-binding transcriptional regulator [Paracoccus albicereus]